MILSLYSRAICTVVTGGTRLGMQIARPNWRLQAATVSASAGPSRRWWWKSSGFGIVRDAGASVGGISAPAPSRLRAWETDGDVAGV